MFYRLTGAALLLAASVFAITGANIITTTGTSPFSFTGQPAFVTSWNQTVGYTGVRINMSLVDNTPTPLSGVEGTVYLTNQIGPGTTTANQIASPVQVSGLTASFSTVLLFSNLTLPPGNYYVTLVPTNTNPMSASPEGSSGANVSVTTGTSVTTLGAGVPSTVAAFPPASAVTLNTPGNIFITVTGFLAPSLTPAPSSMLLMLTVLAIAGAGLWFAKRKFSAA
jgi:hypothetical protein